MLEVGFFGFLLLVADVYAVVKIIESGASTGKKVIWTVAIIMLPVLGLIAWFLFGPSSKRSLA